MGAVAGLSICKDNHANRRCASGDVVFTRDVETITVNAGAMLMKYEFIYFFLATWGQHSKLKATTTTYCFIDNMQIWSVLYWIKWDYSWHLGEGGSTLAPQEETSLTWSAVSEGWNNIKMSTKKDVSKTAQVQRCDKPFNSGTETGCADVEHRVPTEARRVQKHARKCRFAQSMTILSTQFLYWICGAPLKLHTPY